jgi:glycine dehydrogenase subunit 1
MRYIPSSPEEQRALLAEVGATKFDDLFATVPHEVLLEHPLDLPPPMSEIELRREFGAMAAKNASLSCFASFLGGGLHVHHSPAFVSQILLRGELLTAYTPYQPEVSQGTLTAIWEFQSHVALLTELDVANASMYEGASAFVEACLMAERLTKKRTKVVVSKGVHPEYRAALRTYLANFPFTIVEVPLGGDGRTDAAALAAAVDQATFAACVQSPNVMGVVEDWKGVAEVAHAKGAVAVGAIAEMVSLGVLRGPGAFGIDIACGEAASFGVPPSFGGPLVGFLACKDAFKRQIPGRLAGRTVDAKGNPAFCLTLATREQHIRRERATSNICTNQGLIALAATMTLTALGKHGIREMALQCLSKTEELKRLVSAVPGFSVAFSGPTFDEFALRCPVPARDVLAELEKAQILGGVPLERIAPDEPGWTDLLLVCVTERNRKEELERYATTLRRIAR